MARKETTIERIVREKTPNFCVSTDYFIDKFHSYKKWSCPVHFKNDCYVQKRGMNNEVHFNRNFRMAMPDFVLMSDKQMSYLRRAIYRANKGLSYQNPFVRNNGWYIETFGEYWHSEEITGLSKEEHEKQVVDAYTSGGNHILILWENDILNHWQEVCKPKLAKYFEDFKKENVVSEEMDYSCEKELSDDAIACLNDCMVYRDFDDQRKQDIVNELTDCFQNVDAFVDYEDARYDFEKLKTKTIDGYSIIGNAVLDYFIRSRFDAKVKGHKSLNEIWKDTSLMKKSIDWQFMNETGVHNAKRIFAAMCSCSGFRTVSNLNHGYVYIRCKKYAVKDGIFFDPCAGWGGRMLGAYLLGMKYVAIDANKKLVEELKRLAEFMNYDAEIYYGDSSDEKFVNSVLKRRKIDLAFTCPPYYNEEIYSDDEFQSEKGRTKQEWNNEFLQPMINNVMKHLKGKFIISVDEKVDLRALKQKIKKMTYCLSWKEDYYYEVTEQSEIENVDYVRCRICGQCYTKLGNHIKKTHKMTIDDYKNTYGGLIVAEKTSELIGRNNKSVVGKKYQKRVVYLMPDGTYASKSDMYKRAWNTDTIKEEHIIETKDIDYLPKYKQMYEGVEGEDYVTCTVCGEHKQNLKQHIRKCHGLSVEDYHGEIYCEKAKRAFHDCAVKKWKTQKKIG